MDTGARVYPIGPVVKAGQRYKNTLGRFEPIKGLNSLSVGQGLTLTRATGATVQDFEGVTHEVKSGELRIGGARRVAPLFISDSGADWIPFGAATIDGNTVNLPEIGNNVQLGGAATLKLGQVITARLGISGVPGERVQIRIQEQSGGVYNQEVATVTLAGGRTDYSISLTVTDASNTATYLAIHNRGLVNQATSLELHYAHIEDVTGQSNQAPSEEIEPTYSAFGAAGVRYYRYTHANSVGQGNVILDARGADITGIKGIKIEPKVTNELSVDATPSAEIAMGSAAAFEAATTNFDAFDNGTGALFGAVADLSAVSVVGLDRFNPAGIVYKIDNSSGTGEAGVNIGLAVNSTDERVLSVYARATGIGAAGIRFNGQATSTTIASSDFARVEVADTPADTTKKFQVFAAAGQVVWFVLPQMETSITGAATSIVPIYGAPVIREADKLTYPTGASLSDFWVRIGVTLDVDGASFPTANYCPFASDDSGGDEVVASGTGTTWADSGGGGTQGADPSGTLAGVESKVAWSAYQTDSDYVVNYARDGVLVNQQTVAGKTLKHSDTALEFAHWSGVVNAVICGHITTLEFGTGPKLADDLTNWSAS